MRVLIDCRMAGWSGVGRYATGLTRALAARDDVDLIQVCAVGDRPPVDSGLGAEVVVAAAHPFGLRGALQLGRIAERLRPDIVHCTHFPTPMPARGPLVVTLHDLTPLHVTAAMPSIVKRGLYGRWNARAARLADRVVVPSRATAADVEGAFPAVRGRLTVTPEAADDFSSGAIGPLAGRLAGLASAPYLLSMGNTKPHKDLRTLLRAFARLDTSLPDLRLLLVGPEPPGYLDAEVGTEPREMRGSVIFTGRIDDHELRALYAGARAFVFPSRYEGFGLPVLEAMALGAPVVCSDAASLPEVVGKAALVFPAGEVGPLWQALTRLLGDEGLREHLSLTGRERAAEFSWERTASATMAVYREALWGVGPLGAKGNKAR